METFTEQIQTSLPRHCGSGVRYRPTSTLPTGQTTSEVQAFDGLATDIDSSIGCKP
jgi:hypothetical protein